MNTQIRTYSKPLLYLGRSAAGCYGRMAVQKREISGGGYSLEDPSISGLHESLDRYYHWLVQGGSVCDKSPVFRTNYSVASNMVVSGPMLKIDLPKNTVKSFFGSPKIYGGDPLTGGELVSLDIYLNLWEKVWARVGQRMGRYIVWRDGNKELIYE